MRALITAFLILLFGVGIAINTAWPHDSGQWGETTPEIRNWYRGLMQPDNKTVACCGEADAYFAEARVRNGKTYAVIVDDRPDEPRHRPHVPIGTEIEVPNHKLKHDAGNPTGHAVIFLSTAGAVYCFVQGTGI